MASDEKPPIRILHLEDSARDADIIGHKLALGGVACHVVVAGSRDCFEAALRDQTFDVVLCDYNLPGYDGLAALQCTKAMRPDAPVIIISGSVGEEEAIKCLQSGATDYLLKERLERLAPAVVRALQEAEERKSRAHAEEALQERERRLSSIFETVADGLFYVEVDQTGTCRIVSVNPALIAMTGLRYDQVVGQRLEEILDTPALAIEQYSRAIRDGSTVRWEEAATFPSGRRIAEVSVTPVFDGSGRCTHLVGAIHDVTEHRQLEAQLRQSQKMENVGQLAGGIAHDFNNLLTVINGMAELALDEIKDNGLGRLENDVQEIRRAGERAAALTRQLLAFSRKQILQPQVIDLRSVVAEVGNMLGRLIGEDILLAIRATDACATVEADRGQIEQLLANLAVNARDAMPQGGALTIEISLCAIDERATDEQGAAIPAGQYVALAVRDTGTGIDEATRRQIFEPFFTTKGPGHGTGLGLSTVYGIVRQSGGFIRLDSRPGHGSCFTILLPRVAPAETRQAEPAAVQSTGGNETILVVEDVIGLRRLMIRTLEAAGYTVLAAASGDDALRLIERHEQPVDLMITDVVMPGMSGRALAERLKDLRPGMKVVYMSGYTDDVVLRHGILGQGMPFVNKPFSNADLIRTIRRTLNGRGASNSAH